MSDNHEAQAEEGRKTGTVLGPCAHVFFEPFVLQAASLWPGIRRVAVGGALARQRAFWKKVAPHEPGRNRRAHVHG